MPELLRGSAVDMLDATEASYDELLGTNLKGPHFLTQQIARWMLERRPRPNRFHHVDFQLHGIH